jgi:hypothetical protein
MQLAADAHNNKNGWSNQQATSARFLKLPGASVWLQCKHTMHVDWAAIQEALVLEGSRQ